MERRQQRLRIGDQLDKGGDIHTTVLTFRIQSSLNQILTTNVSLITNRRSYIPMATCLTVICKTSLAKEFWKLLRLQNRHGYLQRPLLHPVKPRSSLQPKDPRRPPWQRYLIFTLFQSVFFYLVMALFLGGAIIMSVDWRTPEGIAPTFLPY